MTQQMMVHRSLSSMQGGLSRLARVQEQLSTGRVINRVSDSPADATAAMRLRSSIQDQQQYARNAADGSAWLNTADQALQNATDQVRRARDLALQGANSGSMSAQGREALAAEVDQLRQGLISTANTTYLDRPIFGGVTSGTKAYDATGAYIGVDAPVVRAVANGVKVRVDVAGQTAFASTGTSVFDDMTALSTALRANDTTGIRTGIDALKKHLDAISTVQSDVGARAKTVERADVMAGDTELTIKNRLSEIENTDLAAATVDLKLQEVAYQAALGTTARVMQPSLLDFLS
ncbi:MAG: flagellar hook-associated protein FlgL [Nocardioidaceae bacterium]